ncbi:MAG: hypothetical protein K2Y31_10875 [Burkholderiales bacterium]|jgi:hypothetical protein|nr:hypothetical protein [Burkholderiales bacterium]
MRFYYPSVFSLMLLGVFYALAMIGLWLWWTKGLKRKFSGPTAWSVVALVLVAPWLEEFWIAWNFGQLCRKDAGIFVNKTVEVEGFYNSTGAPLDLVRPGGYRFIESYSPEQRRKGSNQGAIRLEFGDAEFTRQAIEKYEKERRPLKAAEKDVLRVDLDERTEALVYPKKGEGWRITKLDKPTARYHYTRNIYGEQIAHKITMQESRVTDNATGEVVGRYIEYGRGPYWFYIGLGVPPYSCDGPDGGPNSRHNSLIYRDVLKPIK